MRKLAKWEKQCIIGGLIAGLLITLLLMPMCARAGETLEENMRFHSLAADIGVEWAYECVWDEVAKETCITNGAIQFLDDMDKRNIQMTSKRRGPALHSHSIGIQFVYGRCWEKNLSIPECQGITNKWIEDQLKSQLVGK